MAASTRKRVQRRRLRRGGTPQPSPGEGATPRRGASPTHHAGALRGGRSEEWIDSIGVAAARTIRTELGLDLAPFPSEQHPVRWLRLAPRTAISGGKPTRGKRAHGRGAPRVTAALRVAVVPLQRSKSALVAALRWQGAARGQGRGHFLHRPQARHPGLPPAVLGPELRRNRRDRLRSTLPQADDRRSHRDREIPQLRPGAPSRFGPPRPPNNTSRFPPPPRFFTSGMLALRIGAAQPARNGWDVGPSARRRVEFDILVEASENWDVTFLP